MAKGNNNLTGRRSSSHNSKPYDANNSFVKKVATKVTDLIPQKSWISKWFNTSQGNGDMLDTTENMEEVQCVDDTQQSPPLKRPRIRMDVTHPPGTFSIQRMTKSSLNQVDVSSESYSVHSDPHEGFEEPVLGECSNRGHLISSTPAAPAQIQSVASQTSELSSLVTVSNNSTANGMDDNSESSESTSGCSSLTPQTNRQEAPTNVSYNSSFSNRKKFMDDKLSFTNHLQSSRSLFLHNSRDSLSSRRPSFNASIMTNTLDRASPLSSPFYNGDTTFGGASAARFQGRSRSLFNNSNELQLKVPRRTSIEVKPVNAAGVDSSGMSQTAKKILEALEHFSSPITDAKKIPIKSTNTSLMLSSSKKRPREEIVQDTTPLKIGLRHLTRELIVPTVPDILKLRRRQKLQDTTLAARKIVSAHSKPPPPLTQEYCLGAQNEDDARHHGKVKSKSKTKLDEEETVPLVNLPNIPLPISSLPNFNFTIPSGPTKVDKTSVKKDETFTFASPIKVTNLEKNLKSVNNFTFSSPINAESKKSFGAHSDAQLHPKTVSSELTSSTDNFMPAVKQNFIWSGPSSGLKLKEKPKEKEKLHDDLPQLKSGSVMDVLCKSNKIEQSASNEAKSQTDSMKSNAENQVTNKVAVTNLDTSAAWECSKCLIIYNNSREQCIACKAYKPKCKDEAQRLSTINNTSDSKTITNNDCFGSQFKVSSNQWECTSCYVRNKESDAKCIACNAANPNVKQDLEKSVTIVSDPLNNNKGIGNSWECPSCMVKNNVSAAACVCCSTLKPNAQKTNLKKTENGTNSNSEQRSDTLTGNVGFKSISSGTVTVTDKPKPSTDFWECPCCMVQNAAQVDMCPCCNTNNPTRSKTPVKKIQFPSTNGFGDKFKKPEGSWTCDSCMVQNKPDATECIACSSSKPGSNVIKSATNNTGSSVKFSFGIPPNSGGFKFGIDKTENQKSDSGPSTQGFKFGSVETSNPPAQFTFGIPKEEKKTNTIKPESVTPAVSKSPTVSLGIQPNDISTTTSTNTKQSEENIEKKPTLAFSFGVPIPETPTVLNEKISTSTSSASAQSAATFVFGAPKTIAVSTDSEIGKSSVTSVTIEASKPKQDTTQVEAPINVSSPTVSTTQPNSHNLNSTPIFTSGTPKNTQVTSDTSTSTVTTTTSLPSVPQCSFSFTDPKTNLVPTTAGPTFGQIASTAAPPKLSPSFTFGENKGSSTTLVTIDKNIPVMPNASTGGSMFSGVSNPPTLFGNVDGKTTPVFGTDDQKAPVFGVNVKKPSAFAVPENKISPFTASKTKPSLFGTCETKLPVFGSNDKPAAAFTPTPQAVTPTVAPAASFGSPASIRPFSETSATPPVFGAFNTGSTSNIFSTTKVTETNTPNTNLFTFGSTPSQSATQSSQSGSGFNFSANTNATSSTQKPLFTFGSSGNTSQSSSGPFGGAAFNNPTAASTSGFTFNAPKPEVPVFGQTGVGGALFGAPQNNTQNQPTPTFSAPGTNTGINFGSTAPGTSTGFNFGAAPSLSGQEGFNFNPPSNPPTFDPNTKPSFNFTRGSAPPRFAAAPQAATSRKIKVAVRRKR